MSVVQLAESLVRSPRTGSRSRPRIVAATIAVLLAVVAFLLFGPIGLGNGPLGVPSMDGRIGLKTAQPTAYVATLVNSGGSAAVLDGVTVTPATGYPPARILTIRVAGHSSYGCVYALTSSLAGCARPPFASATGFAVGPHANTVAGNRGGPALVIEIAGPPAASCVALTAIVVRYHVGIRHYTATVPQGFVWACGVRARQP
jgi:hypothetical protein